MAFVSSRTVHGTYPAAISSVRLADTPTGTVDRLSQDWYVKWPSWKESLADAGVVKNELVEGYEAMWWEEASNVAADTEDTGTLTMGAVGLLDKDDVKRRRRMSMFGQVVSVGPIETVAGEPSYEDITTGSGVSKRWNINDPVITVIDTYFSLTEPDMSVVGTAVVPPDAPDAPSYLWGGYGEPLRANHPNGWVLDARDPEEMIVGLLWKVVDTSSYYQLAQPD